MSVTAFYPRDGLSSAVLAVIMCLSVCPSVRPSQVGVLLIRPNLGLRKQRRTIAQGL